MIIIYKIIYFLILFKFVIYEGIASIYVIDKGLLPLEKNSVGIQFYLDVENKDRLSYCKVKFWTKQCLQTNIHGKRFNDMAVYGANTQIVKPKNRETIIFIYPTIIQENHVGDCKFVLDYQCGKIKKAKRAEISISFDTIINNEKHFYKKSNYDSIDKDILNCEPVNCDLKYIGFLPFYNKKINTCVAAPTCVGNLRKELPDIVYDPRSNICKDLENSLTIADVYAITSGLGVVTEPTNITDVVVKLNSNCSSISENISFLKDMMYGKFYIPYHGSVLNFSSACDSAIFKIVWSVILLSCLVLAFVGFTSFLTWIIKNVSFNDMKNFCVNFKSKLTKCSTKRSKVNKNVKNKLLKDVIITNLPMELRDSFENICERINREVKWKKRYRKEDLGSRINLVEEYKVVSRTCSIESVRDND